MKEESKPEEVTTEMKTELIRELPWSKEVLSFDLKEKMLRFIFEGKTRVRAIQSIDIGTNGEYIIGFLHVPLPKPFSQIGRHPLLVIQTKEDGAVEAMYSNHKERFNSEVTNTVLSYIRDFALVD